MIRNIYENLAQTGTPRQETLCHLAMDEMDPSIRYCAYQLKGTKDVNLKELLEMKRSVGKQDAEGIAPKLDVPLS